MLIQREELLRAAEAIAEQFPADERGHQQEVLRTLVADEHGKSRILALASGDTFALAQRLPGRTALLWPVAGDFEVGGSLVGQLLRQLKEEGLCVAQALLPEHGDQNGKPFEHAGFVDGGPLVFMATEPSSNAASTVNSELTFESIDADDPRLAAVIMNTYTGSRDCPLVDSWRSVADILEGYRGTGEYQPELWRLVHRQSEAIGCVLLSEFGAGRYGELTYLGVVPKNRGLGLGSQLTAWAVEFGARRGWAQLLLAVDAANDPARRIYLEAGFWDFLRRKLWLKRL
jgi:ribosomal protein S18 acetylase RimI-like enzyme